MINIRNYQDGDEQALRAIFFNTIRAINTRDYTEQQMAAWAPENYDKALWLERIRGINPFIAILDEEVVGYCDLQDDGYIDHFFCHWAHQGKGIGKALMNRLIDSATERNIRRLYSQVSITAKPFFEHFGFTVVKPQRVEIRGVSLTNFVMERDL